MQTNAIPTSEVVQVVEANRYEAVIRRHQIGGADRWTYRIRRADGVWVGGGGSYTAGFRSLADARESMRDDLSYLALEDLSELAA